jgi:hypothetical protein
MFQTIASVDTKGTFLTPFRRQAEISAAEAGNADVGEAQTRRLCRRKFNGENILLRSGLEMQVDSYPVNLWSTKRLVESHSIYFCAFITLVTSHKIRLSTMNG